MWRYTIRSSSVLLIMTSINIDDSVEAITTDITSIWNNTGISISNQNLLPYYIIIPVDKQKRTLKNIADFLKNYASDYTITKPNLTYHTPSFTSTPKPNDDVINTHIFIPKTNIIKILNQIENVKTLVNDFKTQIVTLNKLQNGGNILPSSTPPPPSTNNNNTREKMPKSANSTRKRERSRSKK